MTHSLSQQASSAASAARARHVYGHVGSIPDFGKASAKCIEGDVGLTCALNGGPEHYYRSDRKSTLAAIIHTSTNQINNLRSCKVLVRLL